MIFGMKSVMSGGTALLFIDIATLDILRMKRHELESLLLAAEDMIEKHSIP